MKKRLFFTYQEILDRLTGNAPIWKILRRAVSLHKHRKLYSPSGLLMWFDHREELSGAKGFKFRLGGESSFLSYANILHYWQTNAAFQSYFCGLLAGVQFSAFRFETPPITSATAERDFEFVILDSPELARSPDPDMFAEHFTQDAKQNVVTFSNLGNDAIMVVPCPRGEISAYGHLAAFVRGAPELQKCELWGAVGKAMIRRLREKPVWLSTAGPVHPGCTCDLIAGQNITCTILIESMASRRKGPTKRV